MAGKNIASETNQGVRKVSFQNSLEQFLMGLPERSRAIVAARFGIGAESAKTLEEIGKFYGITRERVRQVICSAVAQLAQALEKDKEFASAVGRIESTLEKRNGIMQAEDLIRELSSGDTNEAGPLHAFLESLRSVKCEKATKDHEKLYRLESFSLETWKRVKEAAKKILAEAGETLSDKDLYARFKKISQDDLSQEQFFDFLAVAKDVKQNVFGKWGLTTWSDIKPRGTREKAYLVLKTSKKPLHFREIADLIDQHGLHGKKKRSHPQTVHNELIKDKRFVLVGRGIYALSEWGYKKGTVKEVIEEILKAAKKPLAREEILAEVLKVRQVKKTTIIINLNSFFSRVGKDAYWLKK